MFRFLLILVIFSLAVSVEAQTSLSDANGIYTLNKNSSEEDRATSVKRGSYVENHILGDSVSWALNKFERAFVYYTKTDGAYAVEQEHILKPVLYKKIKEVDKYFIREVTSKRMVPEEGTRRDFKILMLGKKLMAFDTNQVEKDLKKIKDPVKIEEYICNLKFND